MNPSPVTIRPRGDARVPTAGLTCQTAGSLAFACGVEPLASKEGVWAREDGDDDDDENEREDGENREARTSGAIPPRSARPRRRRPRSGRRDVGEAAATRWFFRLVDITGGEGSDLPAALDPPEGHALAVSPAGIVVHAFRGGEPGGGGIERTPQGRRRVRRPTRAPRREEGGDAGGTDAAEGGGAAEEGGDSPGGDSPENARVGSPLACACTRCQREGNESLHPASLRVASARLSASSLSPKGANLASARALHPPDVVSVVLARLRASRGGAEERSKRMRWRHDEILGKLSRDAKVAAMSAVVDKRFALGPAR